MEWLTNARKDEAISIMHALCSGWVDRRLMSWTPKATEAETAASLERMGMVGIYETRAGKPA